MRALQTAATGMMAQEMNVQVISNNVANMRTTGFKRQRVNFQDLLYEQYRRAGAPTSDQNTQVPAGVFVGAGVKTVSTPRIMNQGNISPTEKTYDIAVRGDGFFRITLPDGRTGYTRDGALDLDSQGRLVTAEGNPVDPGITVPNNATSVAISNLGVVSALVPGNAQPQQLGVITLSRFINRTGLESIGDNLYLETAGSGPPIDGTPGAEGFGTLQQGYLEDSNVNAVTEISSLIAAQRAYELNARVISASDQMLNAAAQIFRG
ncbi:MAG: flagellar basal-body rod protein FlgG [Methylocystis sp.]|jgi:flagellar basal-body rod protein FlgG|nr:flagellar basal-body rod protein FlgG [Methylocystis sp.]MCA3583408.1 flagellar basal-body rod protein FlgG [Methylocystis sp.]MCA3589109.1 flagellar basal-body rod protein FlgG [Methylocystis sp.]MCA3591927.1 flagellar basal-body rod protein FlgG [Methylocystis sp.]